MTILKRSDLLTLEAYSTQRAAFREHVIAHKRQRRVHLLEHITLLFEDRLTVQYQIQEMLRIEKIFEAPAIQEELDAYNPLIPDGANLKATMLIEYADPEIRKRELARLGGIEHRVFAEVAGFPRVFAIADEDLDRSEGEKTAAVHFLRFEFSAVEIRALRGGLGLRLGIDDLRCEVAVEVGVECLSSLAGDFATNYALTQTADERP